MAIGAIVKAGAKSLAKEKAKSFITGKGKGKGGALVKAGGQKPTVNPSNLMGRQVGGAKGGVDIPASRQTINVTAMGSDSPVKSGGGSGDITGVTAGNGLSGGGTSGDVSLALDLNELSAAAVDVSADSFAIIDSNDSNGSKKESIVDLVQEWLELT